MEILFIAPIPPPIDGQSKASRVLLDALVKEHHVSVVNLSKSGLKRNVDLFRFFEIFRIFREVFLNRKKKNIIYLSLAESFVGNMRDIFIYFLCRKNLDKMYIHMLGGEGMRKILSEKNWQQRLNAKFMKKLAGVLVEGPRNYELFGQVVSKEKIHIVPNFAEDFLFVSDDEIETKFNDMQEIRILYLSNLIPEKGYNELVDAYLSLSEEEQREIKITFVGGFESENDERVFLKKIEKTSKIQYLGKFIDGEEKRKLYVSNHIFCLPTYYPFEGQPISILEGYASGCVVVTTNHGGIPYIFKDIENGFIIEKKSILSLAGTLRKIILEKKSLKNIALYNKNEALKKFRTKTYQENIIKIFARSFE